MALFRKVKAVEHPLPDGWMIEPEAKRGSYKLEFRVPWAGKEYATSMPLTGANAEGEAFKRVPLIFRAITLRCDSLCRVPVYVYGKGDEIISETDGGDKFFFEEYDLTPLHKATLYNLLWLSEAAYLLKGIAYILKLKNAYQMGKGIQWLNPFTVVAEQVNTNGVISLRFYQQVQGGGRFPRTGYWTLDDFLYMRSFNPLDDLGAGISPAQVALGDSQILQSVTSFLGNFFSADALPVTMITMPSGTDSGERERVEGWFKSRLLGMRKSAARVLGVSADIKIDKLTSELKTFSFDMVDTHAVQGVSDAFGMPQSLLRSQSGANRAISDNERESYLNDTIIPRCKFYERALNPFLEEYGQRIEFAPEELPEMQVDETTRATSLKALVDSGVPLKAGMDILGYDLSDEAQAEIDAAEKKKEERANRVPELAQQIGADGKPIAPSPTPAGGNGKPAQPPLEQIVKATLQEAKLEGEIGNWLGKAQKSVKAGKSPVVEFESEVIPDELKAKVSAALEGKAFLDGLKLGARHNVEDQRKVQEIHDLATELGSLHSSKAGSHSGILQMIHDQAVKLGALCETLAVTVQ
jgi:phage portal protein BeeE